MTTFFSPNPTPLVEFVRNANIAYSYGDHQPFGPTIERHHQNKHLLAVCHKNIAWKLVYAFEYVFGKKRISTKPFKYPKFFVGFINKTHEKPLDFIRTTLENSKQIHLEINGKTYYNYTGVIFLAEHRNFDAYQLFDNDHIVDIHDFDVQTLYSIQNDLTCPKPSLTT